MRNKKGFTLVELLAVIVILAIIALISTPLILNIIAKAKKGAFKDAAYGIIKSAELEYTQLILDGNKKKMIFIYDNGVETSNIEGKILRYKGTKPKSGTVIVDVDGKTAMAIYDGEWCIVKSFDNNQVSLVNKTAEECIIDTTSPEITLNGGEIVSIPLDGIYAEKGVSALDNVDGNLTSSIITTGNVDVNTIGTYEITYKVTDSMGNESVITRTVLVIKTDYAYGGTGVDVFREIVQTSDGGYALIGYITACDGDITDNCKGGNDILVLKLSSIGEVEWNKIYGGSETDIGESIVQINDGSYVIAGITTSANGDITDGNNGSNDILVLKLSSTGEIEWDKTYGGTGNDVVKSIIQTSDEGYGVVGYTDSSDGDITNGNNGNIDVLILKLSSTGELKWNKTYGGSTTDYSYSMIQTSDSGYTITGSTASNDGDITDGNNGGYEALILKLSSTGELEWNKTYGGSSAEQSYSIIQTSDGGYAITGDVMSSDRDITDGNNGVYDVLVLKLSSTGELEWNKTYGGSEDDKGKLIIQTSDGGYAITGEVISSDGDITDGNNGATDVLLLKLSSTGEIEWNKTYGGSNGDVVKSLIQTRDGGYVTIGYTGSSDGDITDGNNGSLDAFFLHTDENGNK